jgi:hypothetical protein
MRAVPAFELTLGLSATERSWVALLAAVVAAGLAAWIWSHIDAAVGPAGRGAWLWLTVVPAAAGAGAWIGWRGSHQQPLTLRWQHGQWSWTDGRIEHDGTVQPKLDLGSWLLLALRSQQGPAHWATVARQRAGAAWHPLRATLFAPQHVAAEPDAGEGASR